MPSPITDFTRRFFARNRLLKLLSLALALCVWGTSTFSPKTTARFLLPVRIKNIPNGYIVDGPVPKVIEVALEGPPARISRTQRSNPAVVLDLNGTTKPGTIAFPHLETHLKLCEGVTVTRVFPSSMEIRLEAEHSQSGENHP